MANRYIDPVTADEVRRFREIAGLGMYEAKRKLQIAAVEVAIGRHIEDRATRKILQAILDLAK